MLHDIYDIGLVILSVAIAMLTAYTTLDLAALLHSPLNYQNGSSGWYDERSLWESAFGQCILLRC